MKKSLLLTIFTVFLITPLLGQEKAPEKKWSYQGVGGINLSQTSLTNWAAGGENSIAWNVYFNGSISLKDKGWNWDTSLVTDFGQTYTPTNKWQKSVDKLNLTTKLGHKIIDKLNVTMLGDLLTQFAEGYKNAEEQRNGKPAISTLFAPAYITIATGLDYKPFDNLSVFFSPVAGKITTVLDKRLSDLGAFGVKKGEKVFAELGASFVTNYKFEIMKNMNLMTKLSLFTAYTHDFGNIDVNWDVMLSAKINKYISATISTNLIYDDDILIADKDGYMAPRVQFREIFGLGLAYNF